MFGSNHYIPILKWKMAEKQALARLSINDKKFITPLIQLVMPRPSFLKKEGKLKTTVELSAESIVMLRQQLPNLADRKSVV